MSASPQRHSSLGMTQTTALSLAHSSLQVEPLGGQDPLGPLVPSARPGNPTEFSQSDRRGAAGPSPGTRAGQALQLTTLGSYTPAAG